MSTADTTAGGASAAGAEAHNGHITGFGSRTYRSYVLTVLLLIYILNFVDRVILSVVARPLKAELGIGDGQFGLLTGIVFALLYTLIGIPLARVAEVRHRVWIMTVCVILWSFMTAACGLATEITILGATIGAFYVLAACRVLVGIGEAGCTPPANSLIADYYPPVKRSTALGYYAMGVTIGTMLSNGFGGPITDALGWRWAFFALGLPGIAVAALLKFTVKEPPRGYTDPPGTVKQERAAFTEALKELFSKPSYWWMTFGATFAAFSGYAIGAFQSLYLQRTFDLSAGQAAVWFNVPSYGASAVGTFVMGWLMERAAKSSPSAVAWMPAVGLIACVPVYWWAFTTSSMTICLVTLMIGGFVKYGYLAAQYTIGQGVVGMRTRATAIAIMLFVINLIGYGLGPVFAGYVSDFFFWQLLGDAGYLGEVTRATCDGAQQALSDFRLAEGLSVLSDAQTAQVLQGLTPPVGTDVLDFCNQANAESTRNSMLALGAIYAFAGFLFLMCARTVSKEMLAR